MHCGLGARSLAAMLCMCWWAAVQGAFFTFYSFSYVLLLMLRNMGTVKRLRSDKLIKADAANPPTASTPKAQPEGDSAATVAACELLYRPPTTLARWLTHWRVMWLMPWHRFQWGSTLMLELGGKIPEDTPRKLTTQLSLSQICDAIRSAAYDPRIPGLYLKLSPLQCGWAKLQELRRHLDFFRASGKFTVAYLERGGEKEYFLASACAQLLVPPSAQLHLRGFWMAGSFVRGVLDNVGIQPQVVRCGKYKSAADQLTHTDMSDAQRKQLTELVEDMQQQFEQTVAAARGKAAEDVAGLLDQGVYDTAVLAREGWVDAVLYEGDVLQRIKEMAGSSGAVAPFVPCHRYCTTPASMFGLGGRRSLAIIRASGMILAGSGGLGGLETVNAASVVRQVRQAKRDRSIKAVVLRVDSPGGDALVSDILWREVQELSRVKPVVASLSDVAGSGGYYLAMAAQQLVAEPLSITGSIGVVSGKFNLAELYNKVGYNKVVVSSGKFAEVLQDNREFTEEEQRLWEEMAQFSYETFRSKAAASRGMDVEAMEKVARGRVWSGTRALKVGLVDALGGVHLAIALAKQAAGIPQAEHVNTPDLSHNWATYPLQLLCSFRPTIAATLGGSGGGVLAAALQGLDGDAVQCLGAVAQGVSGSAAGQALLQQAALAGQGAPGQGFHAFLMPHLG